MWTLLRKDLLLELRSLEGLAAVAVLALLVVLVFVFATPEGLGAEGAAAALWLALLFAGTVGVGRSLLVERERAALAGLLAAPVDPGAIFLAKALANLVVLAWLAAVLLPVVAVLFGVDPLRAPAALAAVLVLGAAGFVFVATLFGAVAARLRSHESLLPILVFPLVSPVVIAGVEATSLLLGGAPAAEAGVWIRLLLAFDVVFGVAGWLLFESVVRG